jgi:hypothetical protein
MNRCKSPECGKEIPEGKNYCDEKCQRRHIALKKLKLVSEENLWLGQDRRKRAMETIMKLARQHCPMPYKRFACTVSFTTGLSLRKVTDDYLVVLLELGFLKRNDGILELGRPES